MRALFEANGLMLIRGDIRREQRDLDAYLELAGAEGEARERARGLAPADPYRIETGWYLLRR
jgi:hypothetical protein